MIGYPANADYGLAIFVWAVANWMYPIITPYVVGFIGMAVAFFIVPLSTVFSGFSNSVFWVIVGSYFIAVAFMKSNLARRVGLYLVRLGSGSVLGALLATTWANTIFSPVVMSNTARGGLFAPITAGVADAFGSKPGDNKGGKAIFLANTFINVLNTNWVLTALSTNLLALGFFTQTFNMSISWVKWLLLSFPMLVTVALVPFIVYQMFPPTTKETSEAKMSVKHYADEELNKMGPLSSVEKRAMAFFVLILALFIAISFTTIDLAFVAVLAMILAVMPPFEIVTPKDALNYVEWGVVLWLGAAISIGSIGASTGVFKALTQLIFVKSGIVAVPVTLFVILLVLIMMYFHAISPGYVAYTVALVPITLEMVKAVHFANPALLGFLVIFTMGAGAAFFPFNSAPNLFFYGYGYYNEREFLKGGLVLSVITILNILLLFFLWWPLVGI